MNRMLKATQRDLCAVMLLTIHLPWDYKDWQRQKGRRCFTKPHFTHVLCSLIKKKRRNPEQLTTNFTNPTSYLCFDFAYASSAFDLLLLLIFYDKLWFLFEFFCFYPFFLAFLLLFSFLLFPLNTRHLRLMRCQFRFGRLFFFCTLHIRSVREFESLSFSSTETHLIFFHSGQMNVFSKQSLLHSDTIAEYIWCAWKMWKEREQEKLVNLYAGHDHVWRTNKNTFTSNSVMLLRLFGADECIKPSTVLAVEHPTTTLAHILHWCADEMFFSQAIIASFFAKQKVNCLFFAQFSLFFQHQRDNRMNFNFWRIAKWFYFYKFPAEKKLNE